MPDEIKQLILIRDILNDYMINPHTPVEIRSNELYDLIIRKNQKLAKIFPTPKKFNQFLRKHHDTGILKQIIPNYDADTTIHHHYKWKFRKDNRQNANITRGHQTEIIKSKYIFYPEGLNISTSTGELVRSYQERNIFEKLVVCNYLKIHYEYPIKLNSTKRILADFFIKNKVTGKEFIWEHFGMTGNEEYDDYKENKVKLLHDNGYKPIQEGGNLIYTHYQNENNFLKNIENIIEQFIK